jgi:hypothetical protein
MNQKWKRRPLMMALASLLLSAGCASGDRGRETDHGAAPHFGDQMEGIGRRFERLGRAGLAHRWEFARYEQHEIRESIEELNGSAIPEDLKALDVPRLTETLVASALPALDSTLARQDSAGFRSTYGRVAQRCNACHQAANRQFIQIPEQPGVEVPVLTPLHRETPQ